AIAREPGAALAVRLRGGLPRAFSWRVRRREAADPRGLATAGGGGRLLRADQPVVLLERRAAGNKLPRRPLLRDGPPGRLGPGLEAGRRAVESGAVGRNRGEHLRGFGDRPG